jgi:protein-disulfide isomerase
MTSLRKILFAAPLLLALASCNSEETGDAALQGEVAAEVAPPAGTTWSATAVRTPEGGWLVGNPDAPIKLIEYGSLTCPACAAFSVEGSAPLHADYIDSGRVNYEFRTVLIHGVVDLLISRMLECAPVAAAVPLADQVWANLDTVSGGFQANGPALEQAMTLPEGERFVALSELGGLTEFFAARGISADQSKVCMADGAAVETLANSSSAQAEKDGVNSTPTFLVNGQKLDGTRWSDVEAALQRAGAR